MNAPKNRYLFEYEHGSCKRVRQSKAGKVPQSHGVHKIARANAGFGIVLAGAEKLDFKIKLPQRT
jgi:hypothetical protein